MSSERDVTPLGAVVQSTRPAFLLLTPVCVLLGLASASATPAPVNAWLFVVVLLGAVSAHASVNVLNEYLDFRSGLDLRTDRTPFSGGSGALPARPDMARAVLLAGLACLALTAVIGLYLVARHTLQLLPLGLVGVLVIVTYTQWLNRSPLLCLVAPGVGFGMLMVVGTDLVLSGGWSPLAVQVSLVPFFLVNNLLLLNQYPDIEADAAVGRRHFPIAFGVAASNLVYGMFACLACAAIVLLTVGGRIPAASLVALAPMVLVLYALTGATRHGARIGEHPQYLAANVAAALLTPLLLALAMLYG